MLNHVKVAKYLIEYLEDRKDELVDNESVRDWFQQAIKFLDDYKNEIQDELEWEHNEKYIPADSYYNF